MKLEMWRPLFDFETGWDPLIRMSRLSDESGDLVFRPSMDITRSESEMVVTAELPGLDPERDIEITLDDDLLTIAGEKSEQSETTEDDRLIRERRYGRFMRRIPVPDGVTAEMIRAGYSDGVLTVTVSIPVAVSQTPTKVPVTTAG